MNGVLVAATAWLGLNGLGALALGAYARVLHRRARRGAPRRRPALRPLGD